MNHMAAAPMSLKIRTHMKSIILTLFIFNWRMERSKMSASALLRRKHRKAEKGRNKMVDEFLKKTIEKIENYQGENWIEIDPDNLIK